MFAFGTEEPEFAALGGVKMYARGKRTLGQREVVSELIEGLLRPGFELAPETPPVAAEAIGGAIYTLLYEQAKENGTTRRAERMVAIAVYVALAPFVGAEKAYGVARGADDSGRRSRRVGRSLGTGGAVDELGSGWGFEGVAIWKEGRRSATTRVGYAGSSGQQVSGAYLGRSRGTGYLHKGRGWRNSPPSPEPS